MRSQALKDIFYGTVGKLTIVSYWKHRLLYSASKAKSPVLLNLGSGAIRPALPGVINIDGNILNRPDLWLDINFGLPFPDKSVDLVYSSHFIEHLTEKQVRALFEECNRVLRPGGTIRLVTPSLDKSIQAYVKADLNFFSTWPDERRSLGGRFNNHLLCRDQHKLMFDFSFMKELLELAGFENIAEKTPTSSMTLSPEQLKKLEKETEEHADSLFVEAKRPLASSQADREPLKKTG